MISKEVLEEYDKFLKRKGLHLEAIVIGGTALNLLGYIARPTRDVDIIAPQLSTKQRQSSREFARTIPGLWEEWLNNGPMSLIDILPLGWENRLQPSFQGEALILQTLGRADLLKTKLFAYCDRGTDLADCVAMSPSPTELEHALDWVIQQDANPLWPNHVRQSFQVLHQRLGHGS